MHVVARTFHVPKAGTTEAEYEDAAHPRGTCISRKSMFRCAIADGATESSFSREWARRLVRHFSVGTLSSPTFREVIPKLQKYWSRQVALRPLPWFAQEAASRGAFAAFLGLALRQSKDGSIVRREWGATAFGDTCLFLIRDGRLTRAFPLASSSAFNNRPFLLSTHTDRWAAEYEARLKTRGTWKPRDEFFLTTDALAHWFLLEYEQADRPWEVLKTLDRGPNATSFCDLITTLRTHGRIRNDDTTLIHVEVRG